jgi:hypothetical protein
MVLDARQEGVAAAGDEAEERRFEGFPIIGLEEVRGDVALEMVDGS